MRWPIPASTFEVALRGALTDHEPPAELLHRSDRGSASTVSDRQERLEAHGMECGTSREDGCPDNGAAESFLAAVGEESVFRTDHATREWATAVILE